MTFDERMISARASVKKLDQEIPAHSSKFEQLEMRIELSKVETNLLIAEALNRIATNVQR